MNIGSSAAAGGHNVNPETHQIDEGKIAEIDSKLKKITDYLKGQGPGAQIELSHTKSSSCVQQKKVGRKITDIPVEMDHEWKKKDIVLLKDFTEFLKLERIESNPEALVLYKNERNAFKRCIDVTVKHAMDLYDDSSLEYLPSFNKPQYLSTVSTQIILPKCTVEEKLKIIELFEKKFPRFF